MRKGRKMIFSNFSHEVTVKRKGTQRKDEDRKMGKGEDGGRQKTVD